MIGIVFSRGGDEVVEIRVNGNSILWRSTVYGSQFFPLDTLDMSEEKVKKEFPDLEDAKNWRDIAVSRLKHEIESHVTEEGKINYIVKELSKIGYTPHSFQRQGGRVMKWASWIQ